MTIAGVPSGGGPSSEKRRKNDEIAEVYIFARTVTFALCNEQFVIYPSYTHDDVYHQSCQIIGLCYSLAAVAMYQVHSLDHAPGGLM